MHTISPNSNYNQIRKIIEEKRENTISIDPKFQKYISECLEKSYRFFPHTLFDQIDKEIAAVHLYLDKIVPIRGAHHPLNKFVYDRTKGTTVPNASFQIIQLLNAIKTDPRLPLEAVALIENWIEGEKATIPLSFINNIFFSQVTKNIPPPSNKLRPSERHQYYIDLLEAGKGLPINPDDMEIYSSAITKHLKKMEHGDELKLPAGTAFHSVRLFIKKTADSENKSSYQLFYSNTGSGMVTIKSKKSTLTVYSPSSNEQIESTAFWNEVIKANVSTNMKALNLLLSSLDSEPKAVADQKAKQKMGTCALQAIANDFKHHIINNASTPEEGYAIYKIIKYLMVSKSQEEGIFISHSAFDKLLTEKAMVRKRYLAWIKALNSEDSFNAIKDAYLAVCKDPRVKKYISPDQTLGAITRGTYSQLEGFSPLKVLKHLDKIIDKAFHQLPRGTREALREEYSVHFTFDDVNYLGLRSMLTMNDYKALLLSQADKSVAYPFFEFLKKVNETIFLYQVADHNALQFYLPEIDKNEYSPLLMKYSEAEGKEATIDLICKLVSKNELALSDVKDHLKHILKTEEHKIYSSLGLKYIESLVLTPTMTADVVENIRIILENLKPSEGSENEIARVETLITKGANVEVKKLLSDYLSVLKKQQVLELLKNGNVAEALNSPKIATLTAAEVMDAFHTARANGIAINNFHFLLFAETKLIEPCRSKVFSSMGMHFFRLKEANNALSIAEQLPEIKDQEELLVNGIKMSLEIGELTLVEELLTLEHFKRGLPLTLFLKSARERASKEVSEAELLQAYEMSPFKKDCVLMQNGKNLHEISPSDFKIEMKRIFDIKDPILASYTALKLVRTLMDLGRLDDAKRVIHDRKCPRFAWKAEIREQLQSLLKK